MSSINSSAGAFTEIILILIGIITGVTLLIAGVAALADPSLRSYKTLKVCLMSGICFGGFCGVFGGLTVAIQALINPKLFSYHPSPATFLTLGLIYGGISAWSGWTIRQILSDR